MVDAELLTRELIHTKFHRSPIASTILIRPRLLAQLTESLDGQITLICAPAGFGKTTLISSWVEHLKAVQGEDNMSPKVAWLSLDKDDGDLNLFLRYMIGAIRTVFPGACPKTEQLFRRDFQNSTEAIINVFGNELALLPSPLILVIDDYHLVTSEAVHGLLNELCNHWPESLHLILISRVNPPLPLANLRVRGQIKEIRGHDLRFTPEEAEEFLHKLLKEPVSRRAVNILQERTEGWIAGLQLAALSLIATDDAEAVITNLQISEVYIFDYLTDEVLAQQPSSIQEFLLLTSILDRFCLPLCDAVTESPERRYNMRDCMDWLERFNLFVIPLDNKRQWYRFHALFKDILHQKLMLEMSPDQINALNRKAAIWCAQEGLMDEALHYALSARDFDLLGTLMEQGLRDVLNREDRPTLERWLRMLPEEFIQRRPGLLMIKAWCLQLAWQVDALKGLLERIEALLEQTDTKDLDTEEMRILRGQLSTLQSQAAFLRNQPERAIALSHEALSIMPMSWMYVRGGALIYLGLGMQAIGQGRDAEHLLLNSFESTTYKTTSYSLRHLMVLCFVNLHDGLLDRVNQTALLMLPLAIESNFAIHQSWAHYFLGLVAYQQNELVTAQQHFEAVIERKEFAQILTWNASIYGLISIYIAQGETEAAWQMWRLLSQTDLQLRGREDARTRSLHARLNMVDGALEEAVNWADATPSIPPDQPLIWQEEVHLTKVRILLAKGNNADGQEALHILDMLFKIAERTFNVQFQIEILALRAVALHSQPDLYAEDPLVVLQQAVALARVGGFIRVFVDLGPRMHDMLALLFQQNVMTSFIGRILVEFPESSSENVRQIVKTGTYFAVSGFNDHLTRREFEILTLISKRLTNQEIAEQLGISLPTVKRHTSNIYSKLEVKRRWDAVVSAQALGILSAQ